MKYLNNLTIVFFILLTKITYSQGPPNPCDSPACQSPNPPPWCCHSADIDINIIIWGFIFIYIILLYIFRKNKNIC